MRLIQGFLKNGAEGCQEADEVWTRSLKCIRSHGLYDFKIRDGMLALPSYWWLFSFFFIPHHAAFFFQVLSGCFIYVTIFLMEKKA